MKTLFPYYSGNITHSKVVGHVDLFSFINSHKNPRLYYKKLIERINLASKNKDKELKNNLKKNLTSFTPSVLIDIGKSRCYENIISFTGLAQIDFDGIDELVAIELKKYLYDEYKEFVCLYLSPSRKGLKGLMRIPVVQTIKEYKEVYQSIIDEFDWIDGHDEAPKNAVLPLYLSYDKDMYYRDDATVWKFKGSLEDQTTFKNLNSNPKPKINNVEGDASVYKSTAYYEKITLDLFSDKIDMIVETPGHTRLRSAALVLGSRVAAGYINMNTAISFGEFKIRNNSYLSKGVENYVKTFHWSLKLTENRPKYYQ